MIDRRWDIQQLGPPSACPPGGADPPPRLRRGLAPQSRKAGGSGQQSLPPHQPPTPWLSQALSSPQSWGPEKPSFPLGLLFSPTHSAHPQRLHRLTHFLSPWFIGLDASEGFEGGVGMPKETAVNLCFRQPRVAWKRAPAAAQPCPLLPPQWSAP